MSTTFGIKIDSDYYSETIDNTDENCVKPIARRIHESMWFTDPLAKFLPDSMKVVAMDNDSQGIHTIKDIKNFIKKQKDKGF